MSDIDRIARQLVHTEPPTDLESRILARLDAVEPDARTSGWAWWIRRAALPVGLAATVIIIAAGLVALRPRVEVQRSQVRGPEVPRSEVPGSKVPGSEVRRSEVTSPEVRRSQVPDPEVRGPEPLPVVTASTDPVLDTEVAAWLSRTIPALVEVPAIAIAHLAFDPLNDAGATQPEPLSITPLIMTTLPLEPLQPGRMNDR